MYDDDDNDGNKHYEMIIGSNVYICQENWEFESRYEIHVLQWIVVVNCQNGKV